MLIGGHFQAALNLLAAEDLRRERPRKVYHRLVEGSAALDRPEDAVRFAGRNISTLEVESVVMRHPAVEQAAAFGIPSPELESEDELKINVVLKDGVEAVVDGQLHESGVFEGEKIQAKCASKYEADYGPEDAATATNDQTA